MVNWLNAGGNHTGFHLTVIVIVLILTLVISIILCMVYYGMKEMKAFCTTIVPLVMEAVALIVLTVTT